jgi:hypothetical protein
MPDCQLFAICRDDDFTFGVLSSRFHTLWALANSSRHGDGRDGGRPRYNAKYCFENFPFPKADHTRRAPIAAAAKRLNELREKWLNPPEWVDHVAEVTRRFPKRIVPKQGHISDLKKRTLTKLYNSKPTWLISAHEELDAAVAKAYGWDDYSSTMSDHTLLSRLLDTNFQRAAAGALTPRAPGTSMLKPQDLMTIRPVEVRKDSGHPGGHLPARTHDDQQRVEDKEPPRTGK